MACWKHVSCTTHLQHGISHFLTHTHAQTCTHAQQCTQTEKADRWIACIPKNTLEKLHACCTFKQQGFCINRHTKHFLYKQKHSLQVHRLICATTCFLALSLSFTHSSLPCIPPGARPTPHTTDPSYFIQKNPCLFLLREHTLPRGCKESQKWGKGLKSHYSILSFDFGLFSTKALTWKAF